MKFNVGQLVRIKEMSEEHTNRYGGLIHVGDIGLIKTVDNDGVFIDNGHNDYPYSIVFKIDKEQYDTTVLSYLECELESVIKKGEQLLLWGEL